MALYMYFYFNNWKKLEGLIVILCRRGFFVWPGPIYLLVRQSEKAWMNNCYSVQKRILRMVGPPSTPTVGGRTMWRQRRDLWWTSYDSSCRPTSQRQNTSLILIQQFFYRATSQRQNVSLILIQFLQANISKVEYQSTSHPAVSLQGNITKVECQSNSHPVLAGQHLKG